MFSKDIFNYYTPIGLKTVDLRLSDVIYYIRLLGICLLAQRQYGERRRQVWKTRASTATAVNFSNAIIPEASSAIISPSSAGAVKNLITSLHKTAASCLSGDLIPGKRI